MGDLQFIFVHGLSGWGSYDARYTRLVLLGHSFSGATICPFYLELLKTIRKAEEEEK